MNYMETQAVTEDWSSVLDVCQSCAYAVAYGASLDEPETYRGMMRWAGWRLVPVCGVDTCDGGFTWARCDMCGQGGRESHGVWADPYSPQAWQDIAALTYMYGMGDGSKSITGAETYRTRPGR